MLPTAAIIRQMSVKPPMMYHHWLFEMGPVQEKKKETMLSSDLEYAGSR